MIQEQIRQLVIDLDPQTKAFAGATMVVQRRVIEDSKHVGDLPNEHRPVATDDLAQFMPDVAEHVKALESTEQILATERETWESNRKQMESTIEDLRSKLSAEAQTNQTLTAILGGIKTLIAKIN